MTTISNGESGLSVRNKLNDIWAGLDLNAYDTSIAATAVDVFVYDTSKDSDGGAWRKRTQHTSWYNETLNTATRGSRREFPAVAVIVAESNKVTIYDGDDPSLPMWMVFGSSSLWASSATCLSLQNGRMTVGGDVIGLRVVDFISDFVGRYSNSGFGVWSISVSDREAPVSFVTTNASAAIVNNDVNDVAMTVLPDAPIDPATGLPVPTIAVATAGGVSVIKDDGTVADITCADAGFTASTIVDFKGSQLWMNQGNTGSVDSVFVFNTPPTADTALTLNSKTGTGADADAYYKEHPTLGDLTLVGDSSTDLVNDIAQGAVGSNDGVTRIYENPTTPASGMVAYVTSSYNSGYQNGDIKGAFLADTDDTDLVGSGELVTNGDFATNDLTGWTDSSTGTGSVDASSGAAVMTTVDSSNRAILDQSFATVAGNTYVLQFTLSSASASTAAVWVGTTQGGNQISASNSIGDGIYAVTFVATSNTAWLRAYGVFAAGSVTIDNVSVKLADEDRSVNNKGLIVNGTVTRSPVATGAELVAYSDFSASNYLEQPYNADLDFGTGDFCVMGWVKTNSTGTQRVLQRDSVSTAQRFSVYIGSNAINMLVDDNTTTRIAASSVNPSSDTWLHFCGIYDGSGGVFTYVNGELSGSATGAALNTLDNANATLRLGISQDGSSPSLGSLALWRISTTAPTAEQIKRIYEDEKVLFQENAACTLYGASDAVTALAHDPVTDLLHVGTSAGRSVFQGLRRVSNTTTAVGTAISASNGLVVEE